MKFPILDDPTFPKSQNPLINIHPKYKIISQFVASKFEAIYPNTSQRDLDFID